jgi:hypothetical protein
MIDIQQYATDQARWDARSLQLQRPGKAYLWFAGLQDEVHEVSDNGAEGSLLAASGVTDYRWSCLGESEGSGVWRLAGVAGSPTLSGLLLV